MRAKTKKPAGETKIKGPPQNPGGDISRGGKDNLPGKNKEKSPPR